MTSFRIGHNSVVNLSGHRGRRHGFKVRLSGFIDDGCRSSFSREIGVLEMVGGLRVQSPHVVPEIDPASGLTGLTLLLGGLTVLRSRRGNPKE